MKKLFFLVLAICFFSCSNDDNKETINNSSPVLVKKIDLEFFGDEDRKSKIRFEYEGNKISKIYENDKMVAEFKFEAEKPIKYIVAYDSKTKTNTISYNNNQLKYYLIDDELERTEYVFEGNVLVKEIGTASTDGIKWHSTNETDFVFEKGNLITKNVHFNSMSPYTVSYEYDKKLNPFSNLNTHQKILMNDLIGGLNSISTNNVIKKSGSSKNLYYEMEYLDNGYLSKLKEIDSETKKVLSIMIFEY